MASFGAEYIVFAEFDGAETTTEAVEYGTVTNLGPLMTANLTLAEANAAIHGDNKAQEDVNDITGGDIAAELTDCSKENAAKILGATYDATNKQVEYGDEDVAPWGGLGYIKNIMRGGVVYYEPHFYAKVKASRTTDNATTKGDSLTFTSWPVNFKMLKPLYRESPYHVEAEFDTYDEAVAWLDGKFGATTGGGGGVTP